MYAIFADFHISIKQQKILSVQILNFFQFLNFPMVVKVLGNCPACTFPNAALGRDLWTKMA